MGKFGTGQGALSGNQEEDGISITGVDDDTEITQAEVDLTEEDDTDDMGFGGKLLGGLASGLQNMGSYQYGMFG